VFVSIQKVHQIINYNFKLLKKKKMKQLLLTAFMLNGSQAWFAFFKKCPSVVASGADEKT
jgi:hypothetical protein